MKYKSSVSSRVTVYERLLASLLQRRGDWTEKIRETGAQEEVESLLDREIEVLVRNVGSVLNLLLSAAPALRDLLQTCSGKTTEGLQ